ncbi:MAG: GNAT family protein [Acidimicrobiales bacterium]
MSVSESSPSPLGLLTLYGMNHRDQFAYLAAVRFGPASDAVRFVKDLEQFISEAFEQFPIRKLYAEVLAPNMHQIKTLLSLGLATIEGQLVGHSYLDGEWQDQYVLAIHRETWQSRTDRYPSLAGPSTGDAGA